jgi:CBS domain containing-hemolysin-like protein
LSRQNLHLVKVRSSQIDLLAQKGSKRAKVAQQLVQKLDSYLSATQLGITLASLGLGAFGEHVMSEIVGSFFANMSITVNPHVVTVPIAFTLNHILSHYHWRTSSKNVWY